MLRQSRATAGHRLRRTYWLPRSCFPAVALAPLADHENESGLTYLCLGLVDFGGDEGSARVFPDAVSFVMRALADPHARVLVHCANGSNRSATVTIAVCMSLLEVRLATAWALVLTRREQAAPLADNRRQLLAHELRVHGAHSMVEGANGTLVPLQGGSSRGAVVTLAPHP